MKFSSPQFGNLVIGISILFILETNAFLPPQYVKEMPDTDVNFNKRVDASFWYNRGLDTLERKYKKLSHYIPPKRVKNIILFLGDGMGISTVTAARKYKSDMNGKRFYESQMAWDDFPNVGLCKTALVDAVIADSAGSATSYLSGINTRLGFIGLDASGDSKCENDQGYVDSIASWAHKAGKTTGFVTTTRITHASPSPLYAHLPAPLRQYEYSGPKVEYVKTHPKCKDIAQQFVNNGRHINVAMGGGRRNFLPDKPIKPEYSAPVDTTMPKGRRGDNRNLIHEWMKDRQRDGKHARLAMNLHEMKSLANSSKQPIDYVLGLFADSHVQYIDKDPDQSEPRLADMVESAIGILSQNKDGYFLFAEGGRIDHGHHAGISRIAITETVEFDRAVEKALELVDLSETLIIVTADHSHTFSIGGYMKHSENILGLSVELALDNKTYTSLMYANGPGAKIGGRPNETIESVTARDYNQQSKVPLGSETHAGEDVPLYAIGPYSQLFGGVIEQSFIPLAIACIAGIPGPTPEVTSRLTAICDNRPAARTISGANTAAQPFSYLSDIPLTVLFCYFFAFSISRMRNQFLHLE